MRNIYVDVDTLRADHTTPYGYHRPTTPNLQRLADKSVVFDRYYCSDSPCMPSRTALTSGQFGITNGVVGYFGSAAQFRLDAGHGPEPDRPLLGQLLQFGGYHTAAVSVFAERHRAYYFHGNFRESIRATPNWGDEDAADVNRAAIDWIRRRADQDNWYLHLTYWEPHRLHPAGRMDRQHHLPRGFRAPRNLTMTARCRPAMDLGKARSRPPDAFPHHEKTTHAAIFIPAQ